jgi:hypothetical protein
MSDRPDAYVDTDGAVTLRAYAIGKCSRALWAALNEVESLAPSEHLETIFAEGHLHEEAVRQLLVSEGAEIDAQHEVTLWVIPGELKIVGHLDGIIENWGQIWEGKALGKDGFRRFQNVGFDAYPEYPWQISTYMIATELPALYTVKNRDSGEIIRLVLDTPPISRAEINAKAIGVYTAWKNQEMPACDPERFLCSYSFLHDEISDDEVVNTIEDPYVEAAAGALMEARAQKKFYADKETELRDDLLKILFPGTHLAGEFRIDIKKVVSQRLSTKKMAEAGLDPNEYKAASESTRVEVKSKGER